MNLLSVEGTKYIKRCSVKSSSIYKVKCILIVHFFFKKREILCDQFSPLQKIHFCCLRFLISCFYHLICLRKKSNLYQEMQREKLYNLHGKAYCNSFNKNIKNAVESIFIRFSPVQKQNLKL